MKEFTRSQMVLSLKANKLDNHRTANFLTDFNCADKFGTVYPAIKVEDFISNLVKLGADMSDWTYVDSKWFKGYEPVLQETTIEDSVEKEETVETEVVADQELDVNNEYVIEDYNDLKEQPDWEWVDNLTNTSPSKKKLEEYARQWNVELKRNRSLKGMIEDFKEALSA